MHISIATKPFNQKNINIFTCEENANLYIYVNKKNCTINVPSDNFCQQCVENYGKIEKENSCYHKSETFDNLYFDENNNVWKECNINNKTFECSKCPEGTFIKNNSPKICEKCSLGEYNNLEESNKCEKCSPGYFQKF